MPPVAPVTNGRLDHSAATIRRVRKTVLSVLLFVALISGLFFMSVVDSNLGLEEKDVKLGATYSMIYANDLGLDWKETYTAVLDDLGVRLFRIPAYWSDIESEAGTYDFTNVDWQVSEAARRGATVILAVGRKLPRWPECHVPGWAKSLDETAAQDAVLRMVEATVIHFSKDPSIVAWQVENEPFFDFGICPPASDEFLAREIAAVRKIDPRPIVVSESGELSTWVRAAAYADILGISTYRVVWSRFTGYFFWPITPKNYQRKALAVRTLVKKIIITELQGEPWTTVPVTAMPLDEQLKLMNPDRLRSNIVFARRIGFPEAYLWGVEWWYWLKKQGHPEMWEAAKAVFRQPSLNEQLKSLQKP